MLDSQPTGGQHCSRVFLGVEAIRKCHFSSGASTAVFEPGFPPEGRGLGFKDAVAADDGVDGQVLLKVQHVAGGNVTVLLISPSPT